VLTNRRVSNKNQSSGTKEELAYPVRVGFEDRTVKIPFTNAIRADLRGVRREVTGSGHIRFAGERNRYGHCDRFWALAMALHAAKRPETGALTSVAGIYYQKTTLLAPRRVYTPRTLQPRARLGYFET
jgi:phage FluMu gp28-like protein